MVIQHNLVAMNANRQFKINHDKTKKVAEKLSSGYKINRAADDAAGLAMSEKMRRLVRGLGQAAENIQEGIGYVQTAEGALNEVHDMLQRMNELAVKSANGTNTEEDREYIDAEVQQLKSELDRVFSTTTFNEKRIWEPDPEARVQIDSEFRQAVTFKNRTISSDITNDNCGVIALGSYKINADATDGVSISWTGYDGKSYETKKISWDELEKKNYNIEMSDYFDETDADQAALFDANGDPVFKHSISFTVEETATIDDIVACINNRTFSSSPHASMSGRYETNTGASTSKDWYVSSTSASYIAAYASHANGTTNAHDFDAADDLFIQAADAAGNPLTNGSATGNVIDSPGVSDVATAKNTDKGWTLSFHMDGVGQVLAESYSISYAAPSDSAADDEKYWWNWSTRYVNGQPEKYKAYIERNVSGGTLDDLMGVLTGKKGVDTSTPGLLSSANGGDANNGGYIELHFRLTSVDPIKYGDGQESTADGNVGYFTLRLSVKNTDTEADILQKINDSLNSTTILDLSANSKGYDGVYTYSPSAANHQIEVPIWGGKCKFWVQAGAEANQHIEIQYESLSNKFLELEDVQVKDVDGCNDAIDRIKSAMNEVSLQRADFGAYQNRLEKAYNVNKNTQENTQYSESVIRDTDMAKTMVEYSNHNILLQAGQSILAQANNYNQGVLQLLQ